MADKIPPVLGMNSGTGQEVSDTGPGFAGASPMEAAWLARSQSAFAASSMWFDAGLRNQIQKNVAHFRSLHPDGTKYNERAWLRSKLFRPKTRSMIRRTEAASGVAFFATSDLVTVTAFNKKDPKAARDAKIRQKLLQRRLENKKTMWFQTVIGGVQDAAVQGVAIGYVYWNFKKAVRATLAIYGVDSDDAESTDGESIETEQENTEQIIADRPQCDIIPIENFRFSPVCDWRDPVGTSPYTVHMIPTTVGEVRRMLRAGEVDADPALAESKSLWLAVCRHDYDSIRAVREGNRVDRYENETDPEHETVWIHRHVHRLNGVDWQWDTVGDQIMLRQPRELLEVHPHLAPGERPYHMGTLVMETHRPIPASPTELVAPMQDEINEQTNLRMDASKMATFGRWRVRRGAAVDTQTLKAGIPQSIIAMDDINRDLLELRQQDVPQSAFAEADRLGVEFDDLSGKFSSTSVANNRQLNQTVGGMNLLSADASQVTELELRTFSQSFVEPVLQQFYNMQSVYEDDAILLQQAADAFGATLEEVEAALSAPGTVSVNVGFNATSPERRIQRISLGFQTIGQIFPQALQSANAAEFVKEVMGALGFDDGERFFPSDTDKDPLVAQLQQQVQQLTQMLQGRTAERQIDAQAKVQVAQIAATSSETREQMRQRITWELGLLQAHNSERSQRLDAIDRMLASEQNDIKRRELNMEREALSHSINDSNRNFMLQVKQLALKGSEKSAGKGSAVPKETGHSGEGPPDMPGDDTAGTIMRDDFGKIPLLAG